jgi:hypothetical protein
MALEILTIRSLDGPNIYQPQPGVYLELRSEKDRSRRLRDAIKEAAQSVGLVIGFVESAVQPLSDGQGSLRLMCHFVTPQPGIGAELARYVVEGINRRLARDEEWDADGPLFELGKRRRREAPLLEAVRLIAEARQRRLPTLLAPDGDLRLGYGAPGWSLDRAQLQQNGPVEPPWERIGSAPVIALCGDGATDLGQRVAQVLGQRRPLVCALDAGFDEVQAALRDEGAELIVLGLRVDAITARGLPFERCDLAVVVGPVARPAGASWGDEEHLRALGLPLLLTGPNGQALLDGRERALDALLGYAACPVMRFASEDAALAAIGAAFG